MSSSAEREKLVAAIRDSRTDLQRGLKDTRKSVDLPSRIEASVKKNATWWVGGSLVAGMMIASASRGESSEKGAGKKSKASAISVSGLFRLLLKLTSLLFTFSSPILKSVVTREVIEALSNRKGGE